MTKLQQIILAHLPKEMEYTTNGTNTYEVPYNSCLAEIKKALPDIEKDIVEEIEKDRRLIGCYEGCGCRERLLETLTK